MIPVDYEPNFLSTFLIKTRQFCRAYYPVLFYLFTEVCVWPGDMWVQCEIL